MALGDEFAYPAFGWHTLTSAVSAMLNYICQGHVLATKPGRSCLLIHTVSLSLLGFLLSDSKEIRGVLLCMFIQAR